MARTRDTQRKRVYDAEHDFWQASDRLETLAELQAYADKVLRSRWWKVRSRIHTVYVQDGRGRRRGNCDTGRYYSVVKMPRPTRHVAYLLHELAHSLTDGPLDRTRFNREPAHGETFVTNYLLLVKRFMGERAFETLLASFREHGVYWKGAV